MVVLTCRSAMWEAYCRKPLVAKFTEAEKVEPGLNFGVLLVGPLQLETRRVYVVGIARFADDGLGVTAGYPAAVFVSLYVSALGGAPTNRKCRCCPAASGSMCSLAAQ